jgi:carbonic anhydrase
MKTPNVFLLCLASLFGGACSEAPIKETPAEAHPHWTYSGDEGPAAWGHLSPEYAACSTGTTQSPIDLTGATVAGLPPLGLVMNPVPLALENNGHTVQQSVPPGNILEVGGKTYTMIQFHVHHPAEHTLNGQVFPLEVHFVHRSDDGRLAVLGVLVQEGAANVALAPYFDHLPAHAGEKSEAATSLELVAMLPNDRSYFTYSGSLTTPPCSEGVSWYVLQTPITASSAQIAAFSAVYPLNARPVEPLGKRTLQLGGGAAH